MSISGAGLSRTSAPPGRPPRAPVASISTAATGSGSGSGSAAGSALGSRLGESGCCLRRRKSRAKNPATLGLWLDDLQLGLPVARARRLGLHRAARSPRGSGSRLARRRARAPARLGSGSGTVARLAESVTFVPHPDGSISTLPLTSAPSAAAASQSTVRSGSVRDDADLAQLAEVAGQGGRVAQLRPQLGRGLDEGALHLRGDAHRPRCSRDLTRVLPRISARRPSCV